VKEQSVNACIYVAIDGSALDWYC